MSNPTHEEARWLIAHAKETNKVEWLAGWDSGRNYGKLCAEERIIKLLEEYLSAFGAPQEQLMQRRMTDFIALIKGEQE